MGQLHNITNITIITQSGNMDIHNQPSIKTTQPAHKDYSNGNCHSNYSEWKENVCDNGEGILVSRDGGHTCSSDCCTASNQDYRQIVRLYQNTRKQNCQLRNKIVQLQQQVAILQQANRLGQSSNPEMANRYCNRIKFLQQEYSDYKRNIYENSQQEIKHMRKIVEYLVACYQEMLVTTKNTWFNNLMDKIMNQGMNSLLNDPHSIQQLIDKYEGKQKQSNSNNHQSKDIDPSYYYKGEFGIGQFLDQKQSQVLRKRIKQLTTFINSLIALYRNQLCRLREEATGQSHHIMEELKDCIARNFSKITESKPKSSGPNKGNFSISCDEISAKSVEKKIKPTSSHSKIKNRSEANSKKPSLGNSIEIILPNKPPLPSGVGRKIKIDEAVNRTFNVQCMENEGRRSQSKYLNPTPKHARRYDESAGGSAIKSKRKLKIQ